MYSKKGEEGSDDTHISRFASIKRMHLNTPNFELSNIPVTEAKINNTVIVKAHESLSPTVTPIHTERVTKQLIWV